jgi:hypothetical protein
MDILGTLYDNLGLVMFTVACIGLTYYLVRSIVHPEQTLGGAPP